MRSFAGRQELEAEGLDTFINYSHPFLTNYKIPKSL